MDNQIPPSSDGSQEQTSGDPRPEAGPPVPPGDPGPAIPESPAPPAGAQPGGPQWSASPIGQQPPAPQSPERAVQPPATGRPPVYPGVAQPRPQQPPVGPGPSQAGGYGPAVSGTVPPVGPPGPPGIPYGYPPAGGGYPPGGGQPPRRRSAATTVVVVIVVLMLLGAVSILGLGLMVSVLGESDGGGLASTGDRVGVIAVNGVIMSGGRGSTLFGGVDGSLAVMDDLRSAAKDASVKAVVLHINSPGGSAAASHAIFTEVKALAEKKPVVACMEDVAASGGYYVACGADRIVASGSTMTGSIGVIMSGVSYHELMEKVGLESQTLTSGRYKDTGSPLRSMRPDERALLQSMVQDVYEQFVDAVVAGRPNLTREKVRRLADGRILTGRQAQKAGLVDELGTYYDALGIAAKEGGIEGEPKVKTFGPTGGLFEELFGTRRTAPLTPRQALFAMSGPMLLEPTTYTYLMLHSQPLAQAAGASLAP